MMIKNYGCMTEKKLRKTLEWVITNNKFTWGYKYAWCYDKMRFLKACGEFESLPNNIKVNLQVYANIYKKQMVYEELE